MSYKSHRAAFGHHRQGRAMSRQAQVLATRYFCFSSGGTSFTPGRIVNVELNFL